MLKSKSIFSKIAVGFLIGMPIAGYAQYSHACGPDSNCVVLNDRTYRIRMPEGHDGKEAVGAIFFMHGYRGTAKGIMRNKNLGKVISDLGLALIAPKSAYEDWAIPGAPSQHVPVELEYFDAVVEDIKSRFNIDTSRMMASGFSAGGMMTWNLACDRGGLFTAYAPIAGTFWEPTPKNCPTASASIIHTHGKSDRIVPLPGRPIGSTKQGNVQTVLDMYLDHGAFKGSRFSTNDELELECVTSENAKQQILEICLHPGGHSMKSAYVTRAWKKFVDLGIIK